MTNIRAILRVYFVLIFCSLAPLIAQNTVGGDSVVPGVVRFTGVLNGATGQALPGTVGVTFLLYKEQSGGAPLWMETQNVKADESGHYTVMLGSTTNHGIPADAFAAGEARWVGMQVNGQTEQARVQLVSVPYALKAEDAQTLGGLPASAFLLAQQPAGATGATTSASSPQSSSATAVTTPGGTVNALAKFDGANDVASAQIFDNGTNVGIGTSAPAAKLDVKGTSILRGAVTLAASGAATAAAGKNSQPLNLSASAFATIGLALNETFRWQTEPVGNNTASPSGKLNLLFGSGTNTPTETGLSISNKGLITFATGQTFPGNQGGSVKSVALSAPNSDFSVSGSPVTTTGTLNLQWLVPPTDSDVPSAIVKRDVFGNFAASQITASAVNADSMTTGTLFARMAGTTGVGSQLSALTGDASASGNAGPTVGVLGASFSDSGTGVWGEARSSAAQANGVEGLAHGGGSAVVGINTGEPNGNPSGGFGVLAQVLGVSGQAVWAENFGTAVSPNGSGPDGVDGIAHSASGAGVAAVNTAAGDGLFAQSNGGFAAFFVGDVDVDGKLSKAAGSFKIDHPLDPANKYLYHSFVESPDMKNIYDGTVVLDASGAATVEMPEWFEALNRDFRYQLTSVGAPGPNLYVAEEIAGNHFKIAGGKPGAKVSWQVTGTRQDAYANAHRIPVEEAKSDKERGFYLHPELFGAPAEKSIAVARHPNAMKMAKEGKTRIAGSVTP